MKEMEITLTNTKMIKKLADAMEDLAHTNVEMSQTIMKVVDKIEILERKIDHCEPRKLKVVKDDD